MDVDMIFKIAAIGIIVAVLNQLLIRSGREEQALLTTIMGLIVALMMIITQISTLFDTIKSVFGLLWILLQFAWCLLLPLYFP